LQAGTTGGEMKLFLVECKGMKYNVTSAPGGIAYVLAENPSQAYDKLRDILDKRDLGFSHERELESIRLLAEDSDYPNCRMRLIL
jgi:hypothetical protein